LARAPKLRLDKLLVDRGLVSSRSRAQALILAGKVLVADTPVTKAGTQVRPDVDVRLRGTEQPFVSRGGIKLSGALDAFSLSVDDRVAADLGASTGGFTDCLLQRGAARVYAVDVGYGQLAWKLRQDPRVVVLERTNARHMTGDTLPELVDLVVGDLSFISLAKILPAIAAIARPGSDVVALVKPQFEVGRENLGSGGVVRDESARLAALQAVKTAALAQGFTLHGDCESPITGAKGGNVEYLLWARTPISPAQAKV
jgi:23S rRNA (cytidine1920-2'-O)/16S rRNA (cytidine1409-2'-O)-methyltransferase